MVALQLASHALLRPTAESACHAVPGLANLSLFDNAKPPLIVVNLISVAWAGQQVCKALSGPCSAPRNVGPNEEVPRAS